MAIIPSKIDIIYITSFYLMHVCVVVGEGCFLKGSYFGRNEDKLREI